MAKYQYETSPRKIKVDYDEPKEKSSRKQKNQKIAKTKPINQAKILFYIAIGFVTLFVISYRYAVIDKTYSNLKNLKTELAAIEKETAQLEANIESNLKLTTIEEEAKEQLGMQKLNSNQIVYVTLPKSDYVECSSEEIKEVNPDENWFMKIIDKIIETLKQ